MFSTSYKGKTGFSLVEVLFACALVTLALVPIMRAMGANMRHSSEIAERVVRIVSDNNAAAGEAASKRAE